MHNLFLGTAKYVFKLWADNIFTKKQLKEITKKIEELNTATSIGRIQRKLEQTMGTRQRSNGRNGH